MKTLNIMLKPASSLCNMKCRYCFYADVVSSRCTSSYGIMTEDTVDAIIASVYSELESGDRVHFAFQGGEPTLAGLPFFRHFTAVASQREDITVSFALQTNGLELNEEWCGFLKENNFLVGLSLDILPEIHDSARVDSQNQGTYKKITEVLELLKKTGVAFNILCTLTNSLARHPRQVWNQLVKLNIDFVQFTPCLGDLEGTAKNPYTLTPQRFSDFYIQLFQYWFEDYKKDKGRSIKLFDDVVNQMVLGRPTNCGMNGMCTPQLVVEADGSTYPCDFYCLDQYKMGNIAHEPVSALLSSAQVTEFINRPHTQPKLCANCKYRIFCGGSCKRLQKEMCCNVDDNFCGYKAFLDKCGGELHRLAQQIRQKYFSK